MIECVIKDWQGNVAGNASLEFQVASDESAHHIMHRALVRQMNGSRQGTASSKTRSEVRGGGRKPFRQKGTGRARSGSSRTPLKPGGGVIFGPKPRDYSTKMNRKERRLALRTAFQSRAEDLIVVQDFAGEMFRPKTRELVNAMVRWGVDKTESILLIVSIIKDNIYLSARNAPNIKLISSTGLNVYDLLSHDRIVVTASALEKVREVYSD